MVGLVDLVVISICSVLPPIAYMLWMRTADKYEPDDLDDVLKALIAGATLGVFGGAVLTLLLAIPFLIFIGGLDATATSLITAILLAPVAEELVKAGCVMLFRKRLDRLESGIIYGAAVGLGFAVTENILYGVNAATEGLYLALFLVGVRSITAALGHASFTAVTGYGIARWRRRGTEEHTWLKYYALAVIMHAFFNAVASLGDMMDVSLFIEVASIVVLAAMVAATFVLLRRRVKQLDGAASERERTKIVPRP